MTINIVTVNLNNANGLETTISSVQQQTIAPHQLYVVDGGSTDESLSYLASLNHSWLTYSSQPDNGIASAFNRGIEAVSAGHILFLNSGDWLAHDEVLEQLLELKTPGADRCLVVGGVELIRPGGEVVRRVYPPESLSRQRFRNYLPHQAMLIPKELFLLLGSYDESYRLAMDYEWSLRLLMRAAHSYKPVKLLIACMDTEGRSMSSYKETFKQDHLARKKQSVMSSLPSWLLSRFFILRRTIALLVDSRRR